MEKTASTKNTTYTLVAIALMTAVICVLAPLSLPIGPVPISMATLVLFLSIYVLGWKKATISVCLYILLGLVGVPVFSGFTGGVSKLAGATGGYIVGYIPMVALAGFLMSKSDKWWLHLLAMVAGEVVLYLIGTVWFCVLRRSMRRGRMRDILLKNLQEYKVALEENNPEMMKNLLHDGRVLKENNLKKHGKL